MTVSRLLLIILWFCPLAAADIRLPRLISDGMVLQRDQAIVLWGWADSDEVVRVKLDGKLVGKAGSSGGKWSLTLPAQPAGGPHRIELSGHNELALQDVYFGDVWVASGQSNMELPMARVAEAYPEDLATADFPLIRQFKVPQKYHFQAPQADFESGRWVAASPQTVADFSAVAFYFARSLFRQNGVPIGILNNALGGSPVEAWMSEEALQTFPDALAEAERFKNDELVGSIIEADRAKNDKWYGDLNRNDAGLTGPKPWYAPDLDDSDWQGFQVPGFADGPDGEALNGVWWFRKRVHLSAQQAQQADILRLGRIVDADETYINGVRVGHTTYQYPPRRYPIPDGLLKAGDNQITIRVIGNSGRHGFFFDKPYWIGNEQQKTDLTGQWKVKSGALAPALPGDTFIRWKPLGLYNGLTAPLTRLPIKGVIWYQGESNTGRWQDYRAKFTTMIRDWRDKWGQGRFPFLFVQLANFMEKQPQPIDSNWARLREAQTQSLSEPNTAMAITIDVGEWNDIHPVNKQAVGERLALAARALALGEEVVYQGPQLQSVQAKDDSLVLAFDPLAGELVLKSPHDQAFAIAGEDGQFRWAGVEQQGNRIVLSHPEIEAPVQVRYGWADNPDAVLYNGAGLPAGPFEAKVTKR
ncbi:sialate O-acetylesterase [Bowmanella dokdonensis]|uniref:Acetyl esterase n=1 Tax=Bowmanella dokdonensis TaxID=751969 RepID=A0A939DN43_9ALTE|nr:sialate O-acetylesterase [Bowmanella dokdonensis]MBN7825624.1 acetyl esterase [Bowmanella dokdonensis]